MRGAMSDPVGESDPVDEARAAAAAAAAAHVREGMTIGLGSGRAVWRAIEELAPRAGSLRAVVASERTAEAAREAGFELAELDGELRLDVAIDGADEVDPELGLMKGGGGALLREKIVVGAARRFVVVAEERKRVARLGETHPLPVEVVRFAWPETRRRLLELVSSAELRGGDEPFVTDEGHYILDCAVPPGGSLAELGTAIDELPGAVGHGLFIGMADIVLLGRADGSVERLER
jgi:ribose 5-phosphate isomerase A